MQFYLMKSTTNFGFKEVKQYNSKSMRKDASARPSSYSFGPPGTGEMGRESPAEVAVAALFQYLHLLPPPYQER